MNIERYTEKTQSLLQSAQTLALSRSNQKLLPEHLLQVMIDDRDGLVQKLISLSSGNIEILKAESTQILNKIPSVENYFSGFYFHFILFFPKKFFAVASEKKIF